MNFAAPNAHTKTAGQARRGGRWLIDAGAWALGLGTAILARFDFDPAAAPLTATVVAIAVAVVLHTVIGHQQFLYRGRYSFGTFEEVRAVFTTALAVGVGLFSVDLLISSRPVP